MKADRVMLHRIERATPSGGYAIALAFDDGLEAMADFAPLAARGGVFAPLRDPAFFAGVAIGEGGRSLVWPGELEFCADALRESSIPCAAQNAAGGPAADARK